MDGILHQHHIGGLDGNVGSVADGDAHVRLGQGRGVVDAVPHHSHLLVLLHQLLHIPGLILGQHLRVDGGKPYFFGNGLGGSFVIPGDHGGAHPHGLQGPDGGGAVLLHHVRHRHNAGVVPADGHQHGGFSLPGQPVHLLQIGAPRSPFFLLGQVQPGGVSDSHLPALHLSLHPLAGDRGETFHLRQGQLPFHRRGDDGLAQGVLAGPLAGSGQAQQLTFRYSPMGQQVGDPGLPLGDGAGFIKNHSGDMAGKLQGLGVLKEDAVLGPLAGAHHDGGGGGKAQGAGAGDNQHRDKHPQGEARLLARQQPQEGGYHGDGDDGGDKHPGHLVRQPGDGGLGALGVLHQLDDLGQGGVLPHPVGPHPQKASLVDGSPGHLIPRDLIHRHAFPGEHAFIHRRFPGEHHSVGGDLAPRLHQQHIPHLHLRQGDLFFLAIPLHQGGLGGKGHQSLDGFPGAPLGAVLHGLPQQHQGDDHGGAFKVQAVDGVGVPAPDARKAIEAIEEGSGGADGHQAIHIGGTPQQLGISHRVKAVPRPQHRQAEEQLKQGVPLGVGHQVDGHREEHRPHGDAEKGDGEGHGNKEADPQAVGMLPLALFGLLRGLVRHHRKTGVFHHLGNALHPDDGFIILDIRHFGGDVHGGGKNPLAPVQHPLQVGGAGGAVHPADL